jgi:hypothetical protein
MAEEAALPRTPARQGQRTFSREHINLFNRTMPPRTRTIGLVPTNDISSLLALDNLLQRKDCFFMLLRNDWNGQQSAGKRICPSGGEAARLDVWLSWSRKPRRMSRMSFGDCLKKRRIE